MWIGRYLCNNSEGGIIYNLDRTKGLKVYADANFLEDGVLPTQEMQTASYLELALLFVTQTVRWSGAANLKLKLHFLQQKAEYIAKSHALRKTILIQNLIK